MIPFPLQGDSRAITDARVKLAKAARTDFPILLLGESGAGKQAAAEWVHAQSTRRAKPFLEVNASCWNGNSMVHALLFGHEKGAFTGAVHRRPGVFERAHLGSLFLDEIGELDGTIQAMLLKAVDQGMIEPIGASGPKCVDVRLIAATNRDIESEIVSGGFRRDLWSRMSALTIRLPSLRERPEDLEILWRGVCDRFRVTTPLDGALRSRIESEGLPDNLRGLQRLAIERSVWG